MIASKIIHQIQKTVNKKVHTILSFGFGRYTPLELLLPNTKK